MCAKNEKSNETPNENEKEILRLFPERTGQLHELSLFERIFLRSSSAKAAKLKCEKNIVECINRYPLIKLMLGALEKAGCSIDYRRHFSCEYCGPGVGGGYHPEMNQIVICYNKLKSPRMMEPTLTHEMVHMFDYCTTEFDGRNIEHVACAEIRAANLVHCSFVDALFQRAANLIRGARAWNLTPFRIAEAQKECVKTRAIDSIHAGWAQMTRQEIQAVVDKVFDRCYNDLEPIGRQTRDCIKDREYAYRERKHYNYDWSSIY